MSFTEFGLTDKEKSPSREALNKHEMGNKKYQAMVNRGVREDDKKNLPFTFSKPATNGSARNITCWCPSCEAVTRVTKTTCMVVCRGCKDLYSVTDDNSER